MYSIPVRLILDMFDAPEGFVCANFEPLSHEAHAPQLSQCYTNRLVFETPHLIADLLNGLFSALFQYTKDESLGWVQLRRGRVHTQGQGTWAWPLASVH